MQKGYLKPLAFALVIGSAVAAQADVIFNSFGITNEFDPNVGWSVSQSQSMGVKFAVNFGTYTLSEIDVALFAVGNDGSTIVNLCADNAGSPGSVIESFSVVAAPTGTKYFLNSVLNPTLTLGNYFLTLTPGNSNAGSAWCKNGDGVTGPQIFSTNGGASWNGFTDVYGGATVHGNLVPEPATFAILGLGALALVRRRRSVK